MGIRTRSTIHHLCCSRRGAYAVSAVAVLAAAFLVAIAGCAAPEHITVARGAAPLLDTGARPVVQLDSAEDRTGHLSRPIDSIKYEFRDVLESLGFTLRTGPAACLPSSGSTTGDGAGDAPPVPDPPLLSLVLVEYDVPPPGFPYTDKPTIHLTATLRPAGTSLAGAPLWRGTLLLHPAPCEEREAMAILLDFTRQLAARLAADLEADLPEPLAPSASDDAYPEYGQGEAGRPADWDD